MAAAANFNNGRPLLMMDPAPASPGQVAAPAPPGVPGSGLPQHAVAGLPPHQPPVFAAAPGAMAPGAGFVQPQVVPTAPPPQAQLQPQLQQAVLHQPGQPIPMEPTGQVAPAQQQQNTGSMLTAKNLAAASAEAASSAAFSSVVQPPGAPGQPQPINAQYAGANGQALSELDNHKRTMAAVQKWVNSIDLVRLEEDTLAQMTATLDGESVESNLAPTVAWTQQQQLLMQQTSHAAQLLGGGSPAAVAIPPAPGAGATQSGLLDLKDPVYVPTAKKNDAAAPGEAPATTETRSAPDGHAQPTALPQQTTAQPMAAPQQAPQQASFMPMAPQPTYFQPQAMMQQQHLAVPQQQQTAAVPQQQQQLAQPTGAAPQHPGQPTAMQQQQHHQQQQQQMAMQPQYFCYVQQVQGPDGSIQYVPVQMMQQPQQATMQMQQPMAGAYYQTPQHAGQQQAFQMVPAAYQPATATQPMLQGFQQPQAQQSTTQ